MYKSHEWKVCTGSKHLHILDISCNMKKYLNHDANHICRCIHHHFRCSRHHLSKRIGNMNYHLQVGIWLWNACLPHYVSSFCFQRNHQIDSIMGKEEVDPDSKVIYPKYSKDWLSTVAHTIYCVCVVKYQIMV